MHTNPSTAEHAHDINDGLAEAAAAAGYAPSIRGTQPWWWGLDGDTLNLYLERSRVLAVADPDLRLAILSCGCALHHARTTVAAEGWYAAVTRMPDAADQDHLAHLRIERAAPSDPDAVRHVRTIPFRHTNHEAVTGSRVGSEDLRAITASVLAEGAWLHMLAPDQITELATAAVGARHSAVGQPEWLADLAYWADGASTAGVVVPDAVTPQHPAATAGPGGDQGRPIEPSASIGRDRSARFAILYGRSDEPRDWLKAGEALSAAWLTATERGISVLPLSAPVEVVGTRATMRRHLAYLNHPFLVLRFGTLDRAAVQAPQEPRRPTDQTIQRTLLTPGHE